MPYTRTTFSALRSLLASRLWDPDKVFFPDAELKLHIWQSLRFWNVLTGEARAWYNLPLTNPAPSGLYVPSSIWYDLLDITQIPSTPRAATVLDSDVYSWLQWALLEPQSGVPLTLNTAQFEVNDLVSAVQNRRDEFLLATGCVSQIRALNSVPNQNAVALPETVIQARRAYWLPAVGGNPYPLARVDERQLEAYGAGVLAASSDPSVFSAGTEPPLQVSLYPAPNAPGKVEFITQESQAVLSPTASTLLYLPTDYTAAIFYGALGQLLNMTLEARDDDRAQYAMSRFRQFIELAQVSPFILGARIGNVAYYVDAVETLDAYQPNWRVVTNAGNPVLPNIVGTSGRNLIGLPTPGPQQISLLLVQNAPLPVLDADPVQLGDEVMDAILDYAQHIASFKMGAKEVADTMPLFENTIKLAAERNAKVRALASFREILYGTAAREDQINPTRTVLDPEALTGAGGAGGAGGGGGGGGGD